MVFSISRIDFYIPCVLEEDINCVTKNGNISLHSTKMDILYYSNYCKHSQKILQFLVKNNLAEKLNFICVDKRRVDQRTSQVYIILENGSQVLLPPNVHSVPSLLLVKKSYSVITGDEIMANFQSIIDSQNNYATKGNGEPIAFALGGASSVVVSEKYTSFSATPEELSANGTGANRQIGNYASANENFTIYTPPETYKPDKVGQDVTIDMLQQNRKADIGNPQTPSFI